MNRKVEHQARRLRNLLAEAWRCRRSSQVIRRLEAMLRRRWDLLEHERKGLPKPQPE